MRRALPLLPIVLAAALAGCGKTAGGDAAPAAVAEVSTAVLANGAIDRTLTAYGAAEYPAEAETTLTAPMEASVVRLEAIPGAPARRGETIIRLQPSAQSRTDLAKAAADAAQSADALARAERLRASGLDSNADVEAARALDTTNQATLGGLRARARGLTVRSPADGLVESITAAPGDLVAAGASLGKIARAGDLRLRLGVDPAMAAHIPLGASVRLTALAGDAPRGVGVVRLVDPRLDPQTRFAGVIVGAAPRARFAPGEPVRGEIVLGRAVGPVAPRRAVCWEGDKPYVLVVAGGTAHRREVVLGPNDGERVVIAAGVAPGERIVTDGGASLDDGAAVREQAAGVTGA